MIENTFCFTGYRPSKMPFPIDSNNPEYIKFENKLIDSVFSVANEENITFYTGAAMGFDIIAAEIVLLLKKAKGKEANIKLVCAVPFKNQAEKFPEEWKVRYKNVLENADETVILSDTYYRGCYQRRNEYMVDRSNSVITWFDGQSGGTLNTLIYAKKTGKRIVNIRPEGVHEYLYSEEYIVSEEDE